jgi:subtilisin family serine protease
VKSGNPDVRFDIIIALNELFEGGIPAAVEQVSKRANELGVRCTTVSHYVFACLTAQQILDLADEARRLFQERGRRGSVIYRIWEDTAIDASLTKSLATVKADAAQRAFQAHGEGIVGHGTHVAGIIAGHWKAADEMNGDLVVGTEMRDERTNDAVRQRDRLRSISGVAPETKLVSLKVIADVTIPGSESRQTEGQGKVSWVLMAIEQIQQWNQYGKRLLIHGANLSLGYDFDPRWFACGQSPICVEINRLVKSGVSVVVSAGNSGYSSFVLASGRTEARFNDLTITDPGNAELAITVGSTHKEMPHTYGVSYFSSRGPTGDGRAKPDLLAPGERIISCAAGKEAAKYGEGVLFCEQTGTSMAAPHVSGAIAAFLSVRREFIGQPEQVKELFMANCIDLRRERNFQGSGLLDLMKVLQAV